jgi:hypothetical protein
MQSGVVFLRGTMALFLVSSTGQGAAQSTPQRTAEQIRASHEAHQGDFDYLLGDWEFTAVSREYGTSRGFWSAVRLAEGAQILDEFRIVGDSGRTLYVTHSLRAYNAVLDQWDLVSTEGGTGLQDTGTGRKLGAEMLIDQTFGAMSGRPSKWRIRYYHILPDRFSWTADRSTDGGKSWVEQYLQIEARRVGPARSFGPLATWEAGRHRLLSGDRVRGCRGGTDSGTSGARLRPPPP